jgi:thymidylate synthase
VLYAVIFYAELKSVAQILKDRTMKKYLATMHDILDNGDLVYNERTRSFIHKLFGTQTRFLMDEGFPIVTTRQVPWKMPIAEMLWFIRGSTDVRVLEALGGGKIWDLWSSEHSIGPMYGHVLRSIDVVDGQGSNQMVDQLTDAIELLKKDPTSRRNIMTTLDVGKLPRPNLSPQGNVASGQGALMPCHGIVIQLDSSPFTLSEVRRVQEARHFNPNVPGHCKIVPHLASKLRLQVYVRSNDWPVGAVWNIPQYAALLMMIAKETNHHPYELVYTTGDTHIYGNQMPGVREQLDRVPFAAPWLELDPQAPSLFEATLDHFKMHNYKHHPKITMPVTV